MGYFEFMGIENPELFIGSSVIAFIIVVIWDFCRIWFSPSAEAMIFFGMIDSGYNSIRKYFIIGWRLILLFIVSQTLASILYHLVLFNQQ